MTTLLKLDTDIIDLDEILMVTSMGSGAAKVIFKNGEMMYVAMNTAVIWQEMKKMEVVKVSEGGSGE